MELSNQTLHLKILKWNILTHLIYFFFFWKQTLFLLFGDLNIHFSMENVTKPNYWLIPLTQTSVNTQIPSWWPRRLSCMDKAPWRRSLLWIFCTVHLHQARSQSGFLLFWFCKGRISLFPQSGISQSHSANQTNNWLRYFGKFWRCQL